MVTLLLREVFQSIFVQAASTVVEQPTASPVTLGPWTMTTRRWCRMTDWSLCRPLFKFYPHAIMRFPSLVDRNKSFSERVRVNTDEAFVLFCRGHFAIAACIAAG